MAVVVLFSLFFYGWWNPPYVIVILCSIAVNYFFVRAVSKKSSNLMVYIAISINIIFIVYFKYRNFFIENIHIYNDQVGYMGELIIPLGISFYTFQQIALILDGNDGLLKRAPSPLEYAFFVLFFPQLIAGPIILYRELSNQFVNLQEEVSPGFNYFGQGVLVFALGLFKKNALADPLGQDVDRVFSMIADLSMLEVWFGAVAFTFQIFLDFSGYADMAIGLGLMFGFVLPANFHHPYRSTSLIDFWKRWHITMTRFFMMYLYAPMALSMARWTTARSSSSIVIFVMASSVPLMLTFLISGLWHGAAWSFVAFGAVNGIGLVINHAWKELHFPRLPRLLGWALTMLTVVISLVYFRAHNLEHANDLISRMFDLSVLSLPTWLDGLEASLALPVQDWQVFPFGTPALASILLLIVSIILAMVLPDLTQRMESTPKSWKAAFVTAFLLIVGLAFSGKTANFIYFQF